MKPSAAELLAVLPHTQCRRCGFPDCAAYAQALASGQADLNQCPPGGQQGIERLAALTGQPALPLNPKYGVEGPRNVVFVDEAWCIGCTLCLQACPVDAIVGSHKLMHTVIEPLCTGCELCLPVCPVDCIEQENVSGRATGWAAWSAELAEQARQRYELNSTKQRQYKRDNDKTLEKKALLKVPGPAQQSQPTDPTVPDQKRAMIEAALARARAKRLGT